MEREYLERGREQEAHEKSRRGTLRSIKHRKTGAPVSRAEWAASGFVRNPQLAILSNPRDLDLARKAFRQFHATDPREVRRIGKGRKVLVALGDLRELVYQTRRGHRRGPAWFHKFGRGSKLAATPDGRRLFIVTPKGKVAVDWKRGIIS
jgi:hypothetical protein